MWLKSATSFTSVEGCHNMSHMCSFSDWCCCWHSVHSGNRKGTRPVCLFPWRCPELQQLSCSVLSHTAACWVTAKALHHPTWQPSPVLAAPLKAGLGCPRPLSCLALPSWATITWSRSHSRARGSRGMALPDPLWVGMLGLGCQGFCSNTEENEVGTWMENVAACIAGNALLNFTT